MKNNRSERKVMVFGTAALITFLILVYAVGSMIEDSYADGICDAYIICQPGENYVNARTSPSTRKDNIIGRYDCGDKIYVDGKTKNGFMHCVNASLEQDECWVYLGYIVFDKPEWMDGAIAYAVSNGKLAIRRNIGGEVIRWVDNGTALQVLWRSEDWCVTTSGFVMTEYLEFSEVLE